MNSQNHGLKANIQGFQDRLYKVNDVLKYNEKKVNESITINQNTISSNNSFKIITEFNTNEKNN